MEDSYGMKCNNDTWRMRLKPSAKVILKVKYVMKLRDAVFEEKSMQRGKRYKHIPCK